jgi:hypothetical protein
MPMFRMPGGFWWPERPFNVFGHSAAIVQPGDAIGNLFTLNVRIAGMAIFLRLEADIEYQLLNMANTVLRSRAWPGTRDGVITATPDTPHALCLEWPDGDIDLAAGTQYRLAVRVTGSAPVTVYWKPYVATEPGFGVMTWRQSGVWADDATKRVMACMRVVGLPG